MTTQAPDTTLPEQLALNMMDLLNSLALVTSLLRDVIERVETLEDLTFPPLRREAR